MKSTANNVRSACAGVVDVSINNEQLHSSGPTLIESNTKLPEAAAASPDADCGATDDDDDEAVDGGAAPDSKQCLALSTKSAFSRQSANETPDADRNCLSCAMDHALGS